MKLAYLQWYLLLIISLCCFMEFPKRLSYRIVIVLGGLLTFWSVSISFIFIPIFILAVIHTKDKSERLAKLLLLFGAVSACIANVFSFLFGAVETYMANFLFDVNIPHRISLWGTHPITLIHGLFNGVTYKVICSAIFGSELTKELFRHGWGFIYTCSFAFLFLIFLIGLRVRKRLSVSLLTFVYIITFSVAFFIFRSSYLKGFVDGTQVTSHDRYFFVATCVFCLLVFIIGLEFQKMFPTSVVKKIVLSAIIIIFVALHLPSFRMPAWTPKNLYWNKSADLIMEMENKANTEQKMQLLSIPVNPEPWVIELEIVPQETK